MALTPDVRCDRCSNPIAAVPVSVRVLGQLPGRHPWVDLCGRCSAELARWLAPVGPAALPVASPAEDDQVDEAEGD